MKEIEGFIKAGKIIQVSNSIIFGKEKLETTDVKTYLFEHLKANKILESQIHTFQSTNNNLEKALRNWKFDRSKCLFNLLYYVQSSHMQGREETTEACTRCATTLIHEPLIPTLNKESYSQIVQISDIALRNVLDKDSKYIPLYQTYAVGIIYNTERFCPSIFKEIITGDMLKEDLRDFYILLQTLQGKSLYLH